MKHTPAHYTYTPDTFDDRYEVTYDGTAECPLEWEWEGEFYLLEAGYCSTISKYNSDSDTMRAFAELAERHGIDHARKVIKRWLGVEVHTRTITGYEQGEWWKIVWTGNQPIDDLEQWLKGDVYSVFDTLTGESLCGIHADTMLEAAKYYAEEYAEGE